MQDLVENVLKYSDTWYFPYIVAFLCFADTYILLVPNDILLAAAVAANPRKWPLCALLQTLAITFGCLSFSLLGINNIDQMKYYFPSVFESSTWNAVDDYLHRFGLPTAAIGGSILPIHPFLFAGVLSGHTVLSLTVAITIGRIVRNTVICYLSAVGGKAIVRKDE
eukprot:snap_masked-scaffold_1-processed-gene-27.30-mRNA-1 protein AED:0.16 eAED:1.00 QI:0/-1/0/1/-1/1/1/0/165